MRILVVNAGSTNVKLSVLDGEAEAFAATVEGKPPAEAVAAGVEGLRAKGLLPVAAVGHRIVHGGPHFTAGVRLDDAALAELAKVNDLAPLHNPPALAGIAEARTLLPDVPHVAAFDTAFHRTLPDYVRTYAVPWQWTRDWGVRKYGFHGLSHAYCSRRAAEMLGRAGDPSFKVVVAHLGGGCSLCAVRGGESIDTTMGLTPLDGLMMASRSGSVDPGVIEYVMRAHGLTAAQVDHALNKESGLLGVSGVSADLREVRKAAAAGDARAALALGMFAYRVRVGVGAMAAALGGLDALVLTGGIGEHDARMRADVGDLLGFLGVRLDRAANDGAKPDADVSAAGSACRALVVHTREDVTIAREVGRVLSAS